ncbi:MAG: MFS transporter [Planctomycetota bacterium]|nr:MFS transporter [Planctomycetota bacterium]
MPVALLNYLDRQMMATMRDSVMESIPEFADSKNPQEMWGIMLGQFKWVYAVFSLLGGAIADRFSRRWTICASLFAWSAITAWTGHVQSYQELLWARSLMGVSEAFYIPAALALITDYHSEATRSRAVGLHQMAIYLGVICGGFGGYAASHFGWRWAFVSCGILGMLYALPLSLLLRDSPRQLELGSDSLHSDSESSWRSSFLTLLTNPSFLLLVAYFTLPAMAAWVVRDWMPSILKERFGLGQGASGVTATLYWQLAAIVGASLGGMLADRWMQRNGRGRIYVSALGVVMIVPAIFGVGNAVDVTMAVGFLILFGLGWGFFDCNSMPILSQIVGANHRATGYGIMNFVSISFGGLADWGFGRLQDAKVPLNISFGLFALLAIVSIGLVLSIKVRSSDEHAS